MSLVTLWIVGASFVHLVITAIMLSYHSTHSVYMCHFCSWKTLVILGNLTRTAMLINSGLTLRLST